MTVSNSGPEIKPFLLKMHTALRKMDNNDCYFFFLPRFYLFLERGEGRKRGRETLMWERNVNQLPLVHALTRDKTHNLCTCPDQGIWWVTFHFVGQRPTNWVTLVKAVSSFLEKQFGDECGLKHTLGNNGRVEIVWTLEPRGLGSNPDRPFIGWTCHLPTININLMLCKMRIIIHALAGPPQSY